MIQRDMQDAPRIPKNTQAENISSAASGFCSRLPMRRSAPLSAGWRVNWNPSFRLSSPDYCCPMRRAAFLFPDQCLQFSIHQRTLPCTGTRRRKDSVGRPLGRMEVPELRTTDPPDCDGCIALRGCANSAPAALVDAIVLIGLGGVAVGSELAHIASFDSRHHCRPISD